MERNEFRFGDTISSTFHLTCDRETHFILPELQTFTQTIPGFDGVVDYEIGGYGVRNLPADIYYDGDYATLRSNREAIIAWLSSPHGEYKELEFGDEGGKYYKAKITGELNFTNSNDRKIGTIQWVCNPPWQYKDGVMLTPEIIAWNNQDILTGNQWLKEFTASGSLRMTNTGSMAVKPKITLIGYIPSGLNLTYAGAQWQYNADVHYDSIVIDCNAETVTRGSDGANLLPNVDSVKHAFFNFQPGQVEIAVTASGIGAWPLSITIIIEFVPMVMG